MHSLIRVIRLLVTGMLVLACGAAAAAYPDRPVKIIVPYSAGSGMDMLARTLGRELEQRWTQPVVVENRTGAAGNIGTGIVARARPDGYTLLVQIDTMVINPSIYREVGWDPLKDFSPILMAARSTPIALTVAPTLKVESAKDLLALARTKPGTLSYASPGVGTPQHLAMELLKRSAGLHIVHVPFRSTPDAMGQMLAGDIQLMFLPLHVALPQAKAGKLKILAIDGRSRSTMAPEIPSFAEAGLPDMDVAPWYGVLGPVGMPSEVVLRLNEAMSEALTQPAVRESLRAAGLYAAPGTPQEFTAVMKRDRAKWHALVRDLKLTID
jgi:tripartite-type tricarboxylate transporter receptor subunit TctC